MFIFQLMGGLGNQMFQYAAARSLSVKRGIAFKIYFEDPYKEVTRKYNLDVFNLDIEHATKKELKKIAPSRGIQRRVDSLFSLTEKRSYFKEQVYFVFDENLFHCADNSFISGFWQTEKYFAEIGNIIRRDFEFKIDPSTENNLLIKQIKNTTAISVHIRRGDYIHVEKTNNIHGTCSLEYYKKAIDLMLAKIPNAEFYFFSDDMDWVKENIRIAQKAVYVDINDDAHNYEDLRLMSLCKHHIIANSSFSWWGAWLNANEEKVVIAPQKWANIEIATPDLIPTSWIKI